MFPLARAEEGTSSLQSPSWVLGSFLGILKGELKADPGCDLGLSCTALWGKKVQLQQPDQTSSSQTTTSGTVFSSIKQEGCSRFPCKGLTKPQYSRAVTAHPEAGGEWDLGAAALLQSYCKRASLIQSKNGHCPTHSRGILTDL